MLCMSPFSWFQLVSFCYNKTLLNSVLFQQISMSEGVCGDPQICDKVKGDSGIPSLQLVSEVRVIL